MVRERGSGKTPERVVELLRGRVAATSMLEVSKATGLGLAAIGRYLKGVGEPTTATLQKLADYFGRSVAYLRGEEHIDWEKLADSSDVTALQDDVVVILKAVESLGENVGWHEELLVIAKTIMKISDVMIGVNSERIDLRFKVVDNALKKYEGAITRQIEDATKANKNN